jgi:gamma-glutamylcyclotransferase (GGCT)/AIG2-like uncharacterized protein YtfP
MTATNADHRARFLNLSEEAAELNLELEPRVDGRGYILHKPGHYRDGTWTLDLSSLEAVEGALDKVQAGYERLVLVYGSLLSGLGNHPRLSQRGGLAASLAGRATTYVGEYRLLDLGYFPGMIPDEDGNRVAVTGEVYWLDDRALRACDRLEGTPTFYRRTVTSVRLDAGLAKPRPATVETYVYQGGHRGRLSHTPVPSGCWRTHLRGRGRMGF